MIVNSIVRKMVKDTFCTVCGEKTAYEDWKLCRCCWFDKRVADIDKKIKKYLTTHDVYGNVLNTARDAVSGNVNGLQTPH